jgi:hypothetical protein
MASCTQKKSENSTVNKTETESSFFPVGNYLLGDVETIKLQGISPKYVHVKNGISDSSFVQLQQIDSSLSDFLNPMIDSVGLSALVKETKFFDETIAFFTLSYDVKLDALKKTPWRKWDVYVDPETQKVDRIFLVKSISDSTMAQLTWIPKSFAKIVIINNQSSTIEEEKTFIWNY